MHFDYISPLLLTYYNVIPGGKYLIKIFFNFILKNNNYKKNRMNHDDLKIAHII